MIESSKEIIDIIGANSELPGVENHIAPNTPKIMGMKKKFMNLFLLNFANK
tara:strand:- start:191 stop:343 length:153 start_codon:yes stop_codon:yes gene_type:complete